MPQNYNNGRDNLEFYNRLGDNHKELALYFSIKLRTRELWKAGTEGEKIIEWLENINRLQELPEALTDIGRKDLVELATSLFRLEPSLSIADAEIPESELEKIDETDTLTYELPQENSFAELDGNNLDLVLSSDLDSSTPDLQSQESTSSEAEAEIADKPEEEEVNTPIEEMRETDDGQPTLFALWEIALKSDLKEEFVEDYEAEKFLKKMYHQSPQARSGLTQIQKKLWDACQNTEAEVLNQPFHSNLNVLISAPTSSGKSTIAEIFMAIPSLRYETRKCAIYIAPTRALTQAKYADLKNLFSEYEQYFGQIVLSTGEDITDDWRINSAQFSIACMVYEKANILFSQNPKLRKNLGCIVVDEMHMIADLSRGPILEMALTKALFEQTNNLSNEAMRIVLISTEGKPKRDIISFLSVRHDGVWKDLLPFCDDDREVSVEHILVLGTKEPAEQKLVLARKEEELTKKCFYKKILIAEFKNNEQRELSPKNIRDIQVNLDDFKHREEKDESDQKRNGEFNNRLIKLILDLLIEQPKGYRILVFVPSRKEAEHRASTLKDKLQDYWNRNDDEYGFLGSNERHKNLGEKFRELLKNAEDPRMAKTLEQCIKFGLFIHHSDIERKIRAEIEKTCSVISPDMPSQIIFATETLSYGINLAVQDVILCGVKFPNQNRFGELEDEPVFLSNSSYHNMIGRAGRKGKGDRGKAHAYILVPHKSKPIKIVSRYYKMIHSVESKLYCAEDKSIQDNAEFDRSFQNSYGLENGGAKYGASDFSYPFSRSILDALRHLNIGDNAEKQRKKIKIDGLMKLLNRTFYRRITQLSQADNKRENNLFLSAIQIILDDCSSNQLELVEKSSIEGENWYQITPLGESIIDTGTKISTVVELRKIVNAIHSLWDKSYGSHDRDFPMELYLLCVVAQKEVFRDYMRCTPECTKIDSRKWPKDRARENSSRVDSRLKKYLIKLPGIKKLSDEQTSKLIEQLRSEMLDSWNALRETEENYDFGASDSILRLFNGILAWIDGKDRDEVYKLIEEADNLENNNQIKMHKLPHFTEILSYKILFLSKMLEKLRLSSSDSSIIEAEIESERELRILASRLRFGCTSKAVPFFKPSSSEISRKQAEEMLNNDMTPRWILIANLNNLDFAKLGIPLDQLKLLKKDLEKDACGSFKRLAEDLTLGINEDEPKRRLIKNLVEEMPELFSSSVKSFATPIKSKTSFDNLLRQQLNELEGATLVPDSAGKEARWNLYQVQINISPEQIGIEWSGQKAATTPSEKESDEERELQYIEQDRIKIVGIQFNHRWDCQINQKDCNFIQFLNQHEDTKHIAIVPLPWIPSPNELNDNIKTCLHNRIKDGKTTTFITPAAFAAMLVFIVRKFDNLEYYAEKFTKLLVRSGSSSSNFNLVTVEDVRRVMRHRSTDVPSSIMQALLEHFEADGDV